MAEDKVETQELLRLLAQLRSAVQENQAMASELEELRRKENAREAVREVMRTYKSPLQTTIESWGSPGTVFGLDRSAAIYPKVVTPAADLRCKHCGTHNEFAAINQDDGSYLCYECRGH